MSDFRHLELVDFVLSNEVRRLEASLNKEKSVWLSRRALCKKVRENCGRAKGRRIISNGYLENGFSYRVVRHHVLVHYVT